MKKQNKRIQQKRYTIWSYSQLEFSFARSSTSFLNLGTIIILDQTILCCGGCPVHCQVSSTLLASTHQMLIVPSPVVTIKNISRHGQISSLKGVGVALVENH